MASFSTIRFESTVDRPCDVLVNEDSLWNRLSTSVEDGASLPTLPAMAFDETARERLLLKAEPDCGDRYVALYVCQVCGDFSCGVVAARIERIDEAVEWSEVGFFRPESGLEPFAGFEPLRFAWSEYEAAVRADPDGVSTAQN